MKDGDKLGNTVFMGVRLSKAEEIALTSVIIDLADGNKVDDSDVIHKLIENTSKKDELEGEVRELKKKVRKLPSFLVGDEVFVVKDGAIVKGVVASVIMEKKGTTYWYDREQVAGQWKFSDNSIGTTVFHTEQEAMASVSKEKESPMNSSFTSLVKQLREETGCGLLEASKALELCEHNMEVAYEYLKLSSQALARYKIQDGVKIPYSKEDYVELAKRKVEKEKEEKER